MPNNFRSAYLEDMNKKWIEDGNRWWSNPPVPCANVKVYRNLEAVPIEISAKCNLTGRRCVVAYLSGPDGMTSYFYPPESIIVSFSGYEDCPGFRPRP